MAKYELVLFDLDGTLIESRHDISDGINHALSTLNLAPLSEALIASYVGQGMQELIIKVLGSKDDPRIPTLRAAFRDYYQKNLLTKTYLYPGLDKLLADLAAIPVLMGVVTNKPQVMSEKILQGLKLDQHFKWLVGGDTYAFMKPDPRVFSNILRESQKTTDKILMVGDSHIDIHAAKAAGIKSCGVSYGYRARDELIQAGADFVVDTVDQLRKIIFYD